MVLESYSVLSIKCDKPFTNKSYLKNQMIHIGQNNIHVVSVTTFTNKCYLNNHEIIHMREAIFMFPSVTSHLKLQAI